MIVLIGGESRTGKTLLSQRLLERVHYPCTSLDHLKMGLIRGWPDCGFTANDADDVISQALWGILKGMIDTCRENKQNLILEGCYLPPERVCKLSGRDIIALYLGFSSGYIRTHFDDIRRYENVVEQRLSSEQQEVEDCITAHRALRARCIACGLPHFSIQENYVLETDTVLQWITKQIGGHDETGNLL